MANPKKTIKIKSFIESELLAAARTRTHVFRVTVGKKSLFLSFLDISKKLLNKKYSFGYKLNLQQEEKIICSMKIKMWVCQDLNPRP